MKKLYVILIGFFLTITSIVTYFFIIRKNISQEHAEVPALTDQEKKAILEQALKEIIPGYMVTQKEGQCISDESYKKVLEGNYEAAIDITLQGLKKYPHDFTLQSDLAALLGDTAQITPLPLKERMLEKSKAIFERLMKEAKHQPKEAMYPFKNEYYFRHALYKEQYELGKARVDDYWGTNQWKLYGVKGYYCQGVGASRYAKKLIEQGDNKLAFDYAQKAIVAWAQYFSYDNAYYNAYVHYALALGILGYKQEMMRALEKSASIIKRDMDYFEFKQIIDFVEGMGAYSSN